MIRYFVLRLAVIPPALLLIHFLGFAYAHLIRPLRALRNPYLAGVRESAPLWPTYTSHFERILRFEFDPITNPWGGRLEIPMSEVLISAGAASFGLIAIALVLSITVGVFLGLRAARAEPPGIARWLTSLATLGLSMPTFFIGSLFFAFWFLYVLWGGKGVIPLPLGGFGWDSHLIVPTLVLMARPTVQIAQVTAGLLTDELGKQYVVAARSLGHTWRAVRWKHALRNILAALILTIAAGVRMLVGELIVVEWLFDWPGLGNLLAQTLIPSGIVLTRGVIERTLFLNPQVVAMVLAVFAAVFLSTDLVASMLIKRFDPRLRDG